MSNKLLTALSRKPVDTELAVQVLVESTSCTRQQTEEVLAEMLPVLIQLQVEAQMKLDHIIAQQEKGFRITDSKLALYFRNNPVVLNGFDVERDEESCKWVITYKGKSDRLTIDEAYNMLTKKLLTVFGAIDFKFSVISNAILKAYHWENSEDTVEAMTFDSAVIEVASSFKKKFTIPEIRKRLPSLRMASKDIEKFLIDNGWEMTQYGSCRTKFFFKVDE